LKEPVDRRRDRRLGGVASAALWKCVPAAGSFDGQPGQALEGRARGNQLSKSNLLLAAEQLENLFPEKVYYFPSYEIVMDELRDYRYYSADMLHMGQVAIGYIWERFSEHLLSQESKQINRELEPLLRLLEHRPLDPGGDAHRQTLKQQEALRCELQEKYPFLSWEKWGRTNEQELNA
jgi:hypothetical protein